MGTIVKTTEFCDRCKREFEQTTWKQFLHKGSVKKYKKYFFRIPRGENMYDKVIDIDLCKECSKVLDKFLNGESEE